MCKICTNWHPRIKKNHLFLDNFISKDELNRLSGKLLNLTSHSKRNCYRHHFRNILLVIVYNHPHYESITMLREYYEPLFPNIYFCGPEMKTKSRSVHMFDINRGIFGYECLANAIRQNHMAGFKGYFYVNDDVILNFWRLIETSFDKDYIWAYRNGRESLAGPIPQNWYWWISPYGFRNLRRAVDRIQILSKRFTSYRNSLEVFTKNGNNGSTFAYNGRSDIVYIPREHALKFQELSSIFRSESVFLEIAIPTICRFLAQESDIKELYGHYIPGDVRKNDTRVTDSRHFWVTYLKNPNLWFIHPFKLQHRYDNNRELNVLLMKNILIKHSRELACL